MIVNKKEFIESMDGATFNAGMIKFNIPSCDNINSLNGEGVWGWVTPEDKKKYDDDNYNGKLTTILCNQPFEYYNQLSLFDEIVIVCHGKNRPTLDPKWVIENLDKC